MTDAPAPNEPAATDGPAPERRVGRPVVAGVAVAVVLLGASIALALGLRSRADDLAADRDETRAVASVAGAFSEALLSYDHADLNEARSRVLELATDRFDQEYTAGVSTGPVAEQILALEAVATATVRDVYVSAVQAGAESARAVVSVDSEVTSSAGTRRTVGSFLEISLLRVEGEWLVDSVTSLAALDEQVTPAPSGG